MTETTAHVFPRCLTDFFCYADGWPAVGGVLFVDIMLAGESRGSPSSAAETCAPRDIIDVQCTGCTTAGRGLCGTGTSSVWVTWQIPWCVVVVLVVVVVVVIIFVVVVVMVILALWLDGLIVRHWTDCHKIVQLCVHKRRMIKQWNELYMPLTFLHDFSHSCMPVLFISFDSFVWKLSNICTNQTQCAHWPWHWFWRSFGGTQHASTAQPGMSSGFWLVCGTTSAAVSSCSVTSLCWQRTYVFILVVVVSADSCLLLPAAVCCCDVTQELGTRWIAACEMSWYSLHACC